MKIYCPNCFYPNGKDSKYCKNCSLEIIWARDNYKSKLIKALHHKRKDIAILAAKILSKYDGRQTEKALLEIAENSTDPYIQAASIDSLGAVGTNESLKILKIISNSASVIPRSKAIIAIDNIKKRDDGKKKK